MLTASLLTTHFDIIILQIVIQSNSESSTPLKNLSLLNTIWKRGLLVAIYPEKIK